MRIFALILFLGMVCYLTFKTVHKMHEIQAGFDASSDQHIEDHKINRTGLLSRTNVDLPKARLTETQVPQEESGSNDDESTDDSSYRALPTPNPNLDILHLGGDCIFIENCVELCSDRYDIENQGIRDICASGSDPETHFQFDINSTKEMFTECLYPCMQENNEEIIKERKSVE